MPTKIILGYMEGDKIFSKGGIDTWTAQLALTFWDRMLPTNHLWLLPNRSLHRLRLFAIYAYMFSSEQVIEER